MYKDIVAEFIKKMDLDIDLDVQVSGRPPSMASSEFLTNREQGDWAERLVLSAINRMSDKYVAVPYGRTDSLAAGDPGLFGHANF